MAADVMAGGVSTGQMPGEGAEVVDSLGKLPAPLHSPTVIRKKGVAKAGATTGIKRSASTPNVRSLSEIDASNMSAAEKRRNKLGYHRTSIACSMWAPFGQTARGMLTEARSLPQAQNQMSVGRERSS